MTEKKEYCSTVPSTFVQDCRLQHLQQTLPRHWTEKRTRKAAAALARALEGLGQRQVGHQHQDEVVPGLRAHHPAVW